MPICKAYEKEYKQLTAIRCKIEVGNKENKIHQTNADRIREMSDEELMKIIMCPYDISGIPVNMMPCVRNECNKCMMEWLQSGVGE